MPPILERQALGDLAHIGKVEAVLGRSLLREVGAPVLELVELGIDPGERATESLGPELERYARVLIGRLRRHEPTDFRLELGELGPSRHAAPDAILGFVVIDDGIPDVLIEPSLRHRRARLAHASAVATAAAVDDRPAAERRADHRVAAPGAADEARQERRRFLRDLAGLSAAAEGLHRLERLEVDERRMRVRLRMLPVTGLAGIDAVAKDALEARLRPRDAGRRTRIELVELAQELGQADTGGPAREGVPDDARRRLVDLERLRPLARGDHRAPVAERHRARDMHATRDGRALRVRHPAGVLLPLLAREQGAHSEVELVVAVGGVDPFGGRDEAKVGALEGVPHLGGREAVFAREAAHLFDDDPGGLAPLARREGLAKTALAPVTRTRDAGLPHFGAELDAVRRGPCVDRAPLAIARERRVLSRRLAQVGNQGKLLWHGASFRSWGTFIVTQVLRHLCRTSEGASE